MLIPRFVYPFVKRVVGADRIGLAQEWRCPWLWRVGFRSAGERPRITGQPPNLSTGARDVARAVQSSPERVELLKKLACRGPDDPSPEQMIYLIRELHDALCREGVSLKYHRRIAEARTMLDWATDGTWRGGRAQPDVQGSLERYGPEWEQAYAEYQAFLAKHESEERGV